MSKNADILVGRTDENWMSDPPEHHMHATITLSDAHSDNLMHPLPNSRARIPRAWLTLGRAVLRRDEAGPARAALGSLVVKS